MLQGVEWVGWRVVSARLESLHVSGGMAWMECVWKMRGSEWLQVCVGENRGGKERLAKNRTLQLK